MSRVLYSLQTRVNGSSPGIGEPLTFTWKLSWKGNLNSRHLPPYRVIVCGVGLLQFRMLAILYAEDPLSAGLIATSCSKKLLWMSCTSRKNFNNIDT
jgi:hypothetical protein